MRKKVFIILLVLILAAFSLTACSSGKRYTDDNTLVGVYVATFDRKENGDNQLYTYEVYVQLNCDGSYNFVQKCKNPEMTKYNMTGFGHLITTTIMAKSETRSNRFCLQPIDTNTMPTA